MPVDPAANAFVEDFHLAGREMAEELKPSLDLQRGDRAIARDSILDALRYLDFLVAKIISAVGIGDRHPCTIGLVGCLLVRHDGRRVCVSMLKLEK